MKMNVEKDPGNEELKEFIPRTHYDRSTPTEECGVFQLCGYGDKK
jgi:hypothetical protein